jgi:hypothetical protein
MSPLTAPALIAIVTYYLFGGYRIRENRSRGGEKLEDIFLNIFSNPV